MAGILTNSAVDFKHALFRPFQQLEEVSPVKKQDTCHLGVTIFLVCCSNHLFQHFNRYVVAEMAAVNNGCEHFYSGNRCMKGHLNKCQHADPVMIVPDFKDNLPRV